MTAVGVTSLPRVECFFCAQAELLRCRTKSPLPGDNPNWNALWLRRKREKFHAIDERIVESVRSNGYPCAGVDRREKPGPTVVLLHEARFMLHLREDSIHVYPVLRIFLVQQSNERFARCLS